MLLISSSLLLPSLRAFLISLTSHFCLSESLNFRYSFVGKLRKRDDTKDDVVDFVAAVVENDVNRTAVSMCRLHGDMLGKKDYDTLVNRSRSIAGSNRMYMMFSGVGFSSELEELAIMDRNIRLMSLDDIYRQ